MVTRRELLDLVGVTALSLGCSRQGEAEVPADPADLVLFLCGDVMTGRGVDQVLPYPSDPRLYEAFTEDARAYVRLAEDKNGPIQAPTGLADVWGRALEELRKRPAHLRIINLETSVTTSDEPLPKGINYRMNPRNVGCLTAFDVDCCVLANNHVLDWGEAGLIETLETLDRAGLKTAGAGTTLQQAQAPAIFPIGAKNRVLVYAFGEESSGVPPSWSATAHRPGVAFLADLSPRTAAELGQRVARDRRAGDVVVVSLHWGGNWGYEIPPEHRRFAHALIDEAFVDVVYGHSSHHAKGIEVHHGKPILYGCGDFLNDYEGISGHESYRDDLALMYFVRMTTSPARLAGLEMVPLRIKNFTLQRASAADSRWLATLLSREGSRLGTRVEPGSEGALELRWG